MTAEPSFRMTQGYDVLAPRSSEAYPIPCDEWEFLKDKLKQLAEGPWFFHTVGSALIGAGFSTLIAILLGSFPSDTAFKAFVVAWAVVVVTILCGGACLYFGREQRSIKGAKAGEVLRQMEIIERRYERRAV